MWAPLRRTGLLYAACGNGKDEIVYILANSSRLNKDDKVTPLRVTFYKVGVLGSAPPRYPNRQSIPSGTVSQPARYPNRHGVPFSKARLERRPGPFP